jgi:lipoyl(octanoyl) transferase
MEPIFFSNWGIIEYGKAKEQQEALLQEALETKRAYNALMAAERPQALATRHHLIFCAHPAVYTLGKSGHMENLLVNDTRLQELGISFYKTNRGGDITFHGPGQIVGYPVFDLEKFFTDLGRYMRSLEQVIINTIAHYIVPCGLEDKGVTSLKQELGFAVDEEEVCELLRQEFATVFGATIVDDAARPVRSNDSTYQLSGIGKRHYLSLG